VLAVIAALRVFFRSRLDTSLEVLALRHQVAVLKRKRQRTRLTRIDRLLWITLRSAWSRWSDALVIVKPSHCDRLASQRISTVLALAIALSRWTAQSKRRD